MRLLLSSALVLLAGYSSTTTDAFAPVTSGRTICNSRQSTTTTPLFDTAVADETSMADSGKPPEHASEDSNVADAEIPTKLPSDVGMDYVPLATMLATGQLAEADQVRKKIVYYLYLLCRDTLYVHRGGIAVYIEMRYNTDVQFL